MEKAALLWEQVKNKIKDSEALPLDVYNELVNPIVEVYKETSTTIVLVVENNLEKFRIEKFYSNVINNIYAEISGENKRVKFITKEEIEKEEKEHSGFKLNQVNPTEIIKTQRKLRPEYTFENFITGKANRYAYLTALKTAESPVATVNPLYIFGDVGLGKTHLMMAVGHYILDNNPNTNVVYTTAQQFTEDYFNATTKKNVNAIQDFVDYYRSSDVLLVDDIQFLANKNATQEEFFKLFEYLHEQNKQMIITSDRKADDLENIMSRLKSRFSWGILVDIQKPDFELRKNILEHKLSSMISDPSVVDKEAINYIAENFHNNIRELEGALRRFVNYCVSFNIECNLENAKISLESIVVHETEEPEEIDFRNVTEVKKVIAKYYGINVSDLSSATRRHEYVIPRQIAIYIIRSKYNIPLKKIGDYFGDRDHTTIAHACGRAEELIEKDWTVKQDVENILKMLK